MSILASCGSCVKFHSWPSGVYLGSVEVGDQNLCIRNLSWCNQGKQLVIIPSDGNPILVKPLENIACTSPDPGNIKYEPLGIEKVNIVDFSKVVSSFLAVGCPDGQIYVYDIRGQQIVSTYPDMPHEVQFLRYSDQDTLLAGGSGHGQIILYNAKNAMCASLVVPRSYSLSAMNFHPKNSGLLAGASKEGIVAVWNAETGHVALSGKYHTNIVTDVAFCGNCRNVFSTVSLDHKFICHDLRMPEHTQMQQLEYELAAVAFMSNRDEMAVASINGHLICYDRRKLNVPLSTIIAHNKPIKKIAFQTDYTKALEDQQGWPSFGACGLATDSSNVVDDDSIGSFNAECTPSGDCPNIVQNKIPGGIDMLPSTSSQACVQSKIIKVKDEEDPDEVKNELIADVLDLCQRFEDYMNERFFELKIDASKKFILMEDVFDKHKNVFLNIIRNTRALQGNNRKTKTSSSQSKFYVMADTLYRRRTNKKDAHKR